MNGSWDAYLASPADFVGVDDIITILAKEREPGILIIEHTPSSLIISSNGPYSLYMLIAHYKPRGILRRIDPLSF